MKKTPRKSKYIIPIKVSYFNEIIQLDFRGPLPTSENGYKYNLTIIDLFTGFNYNIFCYGLDHLEIIKSITKYISIFGKPKCVSHDNGHGFNSKIYKKWCEIMKIEFM